MKVLVINAGSSSLKFQLIDMKNEEVIAKGNCEKIGIPGSFLKYKANGMEIIIDGDMKDHSVAIKKVLDVLVDKKHGVIKDLKEIGAVGHRVLHGGEIYKESVLVDASVMRNLKKLVPLGPLHMPANITGIEACKKVMKGVPQVAVFDTAFHSQMPKEAFLYAVPYELYKEDKVRRYGFHGTSHKFVSGEMAKILKKPISRLKIITVHIGNGSSIAAVKNGVCIDTSMGFTPIEGLPMGTRCGDIDASVVGYIAQKYNFNGDQVVEFLNKKSGILGLSGVSSDMRDVNSAAENGNERAKMIVPILAYKIKKYIGAYTAAMGGVDAIVFTGGIGENQEDLRELALKGLDFLGIDIDVKKNNKLPRGTVEKISTEKSKVAVYRIPTNEELVIARDTLRLSK
jgi:acetate kinase